MKRRDLLRGALASGSLGLLSACSKAGRVPKAAPGPLAGAPRPTFDPRTKALSDLALEAARTAGASYADVRIADYRTQALRTREARVVSLTDDASRGFGVRVIAQGTWGFAASSQLNEAEVVRVAQKAVAIAKANSALQREPVQLAPGRRHVAIWNTPIRRDAFAVSLEEKVDRLLSINALAMREPGISFVDSSLTIVREHKFFASSEGSAIEQTLERLSPRFTVTSVDQKRGGFETRTSYSDPRAAGYEYVEDFPWQDEVEQAASDARAKHKAPSVEAGKHDLILHPTHLGFSETVRTSKGDGSGWASGVGNTGNSIDYAQCSAVAIDKAQNSVAPRPLAPGKYVTILEPACVASLMQIMLFTMSARSADEGRSYFSEPGGKNKLGQQLFPDAVTVTSDPSSSVAPGASWGDAGLPQRPRTWIDRGRLASLSHERFWAERQGREAVPHPSNLLMAGGSGSLDELIASTKRGVLITSLWYIRFVDPRSLLLTGLTRDGVFWIEDGKLAYPVTNFRWNESPIRVLQNVDAMTKSVRASTRESIATNIAVPALRVKEFELSSVSDAV